MELFESYRNCRLCPRRCGIDRTGAGIKGYCGETDKLRIAYVGPHFGEEPPLTGTRGSGTVFFTGCSLRCSFCQNYQISREKVGREWSSEELSEALKALAEKEKVHNINFVTPDHFFPHMVKTVELFRESSPAVPILLNLSGYQSSELIEFGKDYVDIYLPDYKYSDSSLAARLSRCPDYPVTALDAIAAMVTQKGFLDRTSEGEIASRGVLVRHLILPGHVDNSINALTGLYLEFGPELPLSLMSQYHPVRPQEEPSLNRRISKDEFEKVYCHCLELGFETMFIQFPDNEASSDPKRTPFVPDFRSSLPFAFPGHSSVDNDGGLC